MKVENNNSSPHDEFFKKSLGEKEIAIDYIREFFPKDLVEKLDLSKLKLKNTSYVDDRLKAFFSDVVYTCPYGKKGQHIMVTFLLEHKSSQPKFIHLQLLRYMLEIWEKQLKGNKDLTPIIPILFYHGKRPWKKNPFADSFKGLDDSLKSFIPLFDYILTDLNEWTDEEILSLKVGFLLNTLLLFKHSNEKEYVLKESWKLFWGVKAKGKQGESRNFLMTMLVYILRSNEFSEEEVDIIPKNLIGPIKKDVMTGLEVLINKGFELGAKKGYEDGIEKGIEKGIERGIRPATIYLYQQGMGIKQIAKIQNVSTKLIEKIISELD